MASTSSQVPSSSSSHSMASLSSETLSNSVSYSKDPSTSERPSSDPDFNPPTTTWDVFLSFYGQDTRYKFTSHLYAALDRHGIRTFMDDPELPTGEVISDALIQAIHDSKIYVVVFSENYANSRWCLDELVEIYKCYQKLKRLVIGVYCNIDPSVVRHQKESFEKAFKDHVEGWFKDDMDKVNEWRNTLKNVANFSGKHISAQRSEAHIIDEIVDVILGEINPKTLDVAKFPVGLDSRVKRITTMLSQDTKEGVIRIGLYGMGGVGKTTLAKALYNKLLVSFNRSCFLANVREDSKTTKGLVVLQKQLLNDVLKSKKEVEVHNVEEGTKLIRNRICSAKVLVIIDDIEKLEQYESLAGPFASGSVVIITTRDREILEKIKVEPKYCYRVNVLNDADSLTLFTRHAFGSAKPDSNLMVHFKKIMGLAGRLPLALTVFGSYLSTETEEGWRSYIDMLQRNPDSTIQQKLIISLDRLDLGDHNLKKIFLDIACFFVGWNIRDVIGILETYYSYAEHNIHNLRKRCLLTLNKSGQLGMHDLIRDMGREVARNESRDDPGEHSRLWVPEDICEVLENNKGTKAIEGIIPSDFYLYDRILDQSEVSLAVETFKAMSKLRFLCFKSTVHLNGNFKQTFDDLRWLCWDYCPLFCLPPEFYPRKLVRLELPYSNIRTMWELNKVPHVFLNLKTLIMENSEDLTTTPDFTILPHLETLNLAGCESLEKVDMSIGKLARLICLNLCRCVKLTSLPETICKLRALESLRIDKCSSLEVLPVQIGKLKSLIELNAGGTMISEVPDSIRRLSKLIFLTLSYNSNLKCLPDSICKLRGLKVLSIAYCSGLKALPLELGNIESLTNLHAPGLLVSNLPDSIGRLTRLVQLNISCNKKLKSFPDSICNLRALEVLDISSCIRLKALPVELGNFESLKVFAAENLTVLRLPDSIGRLSKLVKLTLFDNKNLKSIPDSICNLRALEILSISNCIRLKELPIALGNIESLKEFNAEILNVSKLPDSIGSLSKLIYLRLNDNKKLAALPNTMSSMQSLKDLSIGNCYHLLSIAELPPYLKRMWAMNCRSMESIQNLSNLKRLIELDLKDCSHLTEIVGLEELNSITMLHLGGCNLFLLAKIMTKLFFQIYSEFGHEIKIIIPATEFLPDWIVQSPYWIEQSSDDISQSSGSNSPSDGNSQSSGSNSPSSDENNQSSGCVSESSDLGSAVSLGSLDDVMTELINVIDKRSETRDEGSTITFIMPQDVTHDFLGIIICCRPSGWGRFTFGESPYCVENITTGFTRHGSFDNHQDDEVLIIIVPRSLFSARDGDRMKVTTENGRRSRIHLLYKTETQ